MKKNYTLSLLTFLVALFGFFTFSSPVQAALADIQVCADGLFAGGDGTEGDPWQISDPTELYNVTFCSDSENQGNYFILTDDLDLEGFENRYEALGGWIPIGSYIEIDGEDTDFYTGNFYGTFDGNHHIISNLSIDREEDHQALFSSIEEDSLVYDLGIDGATISGEGAGGIASYLHGTIRTSYVKDSVITTINWGGAGGMVRFINDTAVIEDSYVYAVTVRGDDYGTAGGFAGSIQEGMQLDRVYSVGTVSIQTNDPGSVGGLVGGWWEDATINDSFTVAEVSSDDEGPYIGGIVGKWGEPSGDNNYWYNPEEGGLDACIGSDTEYSGDFCTSVTDVSQFKNSENEPLASWDIANTDDEGYEDFNGGYPFLAWEKDGDDAETVWLVFGVVEEEPEPDPEPEEEEEEEEPSPRRSGRSGSRVASKATTNSNVVTPTTSGASDSSTASVASSSSCPFNRHLSEGMTGEDVRNLQGFLNTHNYPVAFSGPGSIGNETTSFGPATKSALEKYQEAHNITIAQGRGLFGPMTTALVCYQLQNGTAGTISTTNTTDTVNTVDTTSTSTPTESNVISVRDLQVGATGEDVTKLQQILIDADAGSASQALKAHGVTQLFGQLTKDALVEYQTVNNIVPASGYFGPLTRTQMKSAGLGGLWW